MRARTLVGLVIVGALALAGGWYFGTAESPRQQRAFNAGQLMFPDLAPRLQQAARIEVTHQDKTMAIARNGDAWGLADRGGYPLQAAKLRGMLTALTELRLVEPRTTDPAQFGRLGLEDPTGKDATSNLLRVLDPAGKPIVGLIVGHRRVRTQGNVPEQVYVRRPDDNQTWLAEGALEVSADPQLWLDRDVMNIDHARVAGVTVTRGDATLEFARDGQKLVLKSPAEHGKIEDYKVEDVARGLELLTFQDVQTDKDAVGEKIGQSVFTLSDGPIVTATVFHGGKDIWVRFSAAPAAGPDAAKVPDAGSRAKDEADKLNARLAGWTYQLGTWKEKSLVPALDDLLAPPEKPAAPAAAGIPSAGVPGAPPTADAPAAAAPAADTPAATPPATAPALAAPAPAAPAAAPKQ